MGNLQVTKAIVSIQSNASDKSWQDSLLALLAKLSELALAKPTLVLSDDQQIFWARSLLQANRYEHIIMAIRQLMHSDKQFVVMGDISSECRRIAAATSTDYAPHRDVSRIPVCVLRDMAICDTNESAMQRIKQRQTARLGVQK